MNDTLIAALRRHGFHPNPAPADTNPSWTRGRRNGNRFAASLTENDTLVVTSTRQRLSGAPPRAGRLEVASSRTFEEIDRFLYEVRRQ